MRWGNRRISGGAILFVCMLPAAAIACTGFLIEELFQVMERPVVIYTGEKPDKKCKH